MKPEGWSPVVAGPCRLRTCVRIGHVRLGSRASRAITIPAYETRAPVLATRPRLDHAAPCDARSCRAGRIDPDEPAGGLDFAEGHIDEDRRGYARREAWL